MRPLARFATLLALALLAACNRTPIEPDTTAASPTNTPVPIVSNADEATSPTTATETTVIAWGPRGSKRGQVAKPNKDGNLGIWFKIQGAPPTRGTVVLFDNQPLKTWAKSGVVTAAVPAAYLATSGKKPIVLKLGGDTGTAISVGDFDVTSNP